ncbi:MAG: TVP38/TMEM64 family inner membrane protein YdjZ [Candidatus Dichloromethanomonas elyunquensis]|nr:MAG: TVP38/TMEM64 family inner membrane protein YdjZ [Candidatus Dichloromethanomonas elyunquensis]
MKKNKNWPAAFLIPVFILLVAVFFYLDRKNAISSVISGLGWPGAIIAILVIAFVCMTPIPSEGILLMFLKIYGIYWGILLAWLGSNISSLATFFIARHYGLFFVKKIIAPERFSTINDWVEEKGTAGLFISRLLPIPAFAVNYAAGVIPSIKIWPYLWTAAVSIIPYYIGTALVFSGIANQTKYWLFLGSIAIVVFWLASYLLSRKKIQQVKTE